MITFLPYPKIVLSLSILTDDQLCIQRMDAKRILATIEGKSRRYRNHPAVEMWVGHKELLKGYLAYAIDEWIMRGKANEIERPEYNPAKFELPLWWGGRIHKTHKSFLLNSNYKYYEKFKWGIESNLPLFWPIKYNGNSKRERDYV